MKPRVLVLIASGSNRDLDVSVACVEAGGNPEVVHINQIRSGERRLSDYQMLLIPGGFSYGDDLGAGRILAADLNYTLGEGTLPPAETLTAFVAAGKPVLGICNGFQALVKSGLLPGPAGRQRATLAPNASNQFECRWVHLRANPDCPSVFTQGLDELIHCPVAHGEGRYLPLDDESLQELRANQQVALTYVNADGGPAAYPANPNGSVLDIAGICNREGTILGLMPHPENHIFPEQHPLSTRGVTGMLGLQLFVNGIRYAASL